MARRPAKAPAKKANAKKAAAKKAASRKGAAAKGAARRASGRLADRALRQEIIETCLAMNAAGINQGSSGNISARNASGFLITPSGVDYEKMTPQQIVQVDLEGGYFGEWLPSSEWRMHLDVYLGKPEAQAVVHTHATYATALSCLRREIPAFHYMIGVTGGATLRCSEYATFGTQALSNTMMTALEDRTACLLANHGMICFADTLPKSLKLAVEIETLCRQYFIACQAGQPVVLGDAEMTGVLARFKTYGLQSDELGENDALAVEAPVRRDAPRRAQKSDQKSGPKRAPKSGKKAGARKRRG